MNIPKLKSLIRSAEISKDIPWAIQSLEEHFRDTDVDLWWLVQGIHELTQKDREQEAKDMARVKTIMDIVSVESLDGLEALAIKGTNSEIQMQEQIETLQQIREEMAEAYVRLLKLLP